MMGFGWFKPNIDKLVSKRDIRGLSKAMDHDDLLVRLPAERGLRATLIAYHEQTAPNLISVAISKLVFYSVSEERFGEIDPLVQIDKAIVTQLLIEGIQNRSRRIGQLINQPLDSLTIAMRSGTPSMFKEEAYGQDAELVRMRRQLFGMMRKLEEILGKDSSAHVRSQSKGVEGEYWINNELDNYLRSKT